MPLKVCLKLDLFLKVCLKLDVSFELGLKLDVSFNVSLNKSLKAGRVRVEIKKKLKCTADIKDVSSSNDTQITRGNCLLRTLLN